MASNGAATALVDACEKLREATTPVFHILVVGFHHQKGCILEYIYPPLSTTQTVQDPSASLTSQLPPEWRHLPHLALPDGCHNYEQDASFFVLGSTQADESSTPRAVYGVACCRQVDSKDVKPSLDITRSTVQKSVCVLCKYPFFGAIEAKLTQVTQAYFDFKDFSKVSILHDALSSLNSAFGGRKIPYDTLLVGLSQQALVLKFGHRLLQVFKALLLRKKVLICGVPTNEVCRMVLGVLSLFPKSLDHFARPDLKSVDDCGFPLQIFTSPFSVQPYLCLQQIDSLAADDSHLLVGVANPLFQKQYSKYCDVYINMEDGLVDTKEPELRSTLYLTAADLRFCDFVHSSVREVMTSSAHSTAWFGSNGWVRSQFRLYLLSLLSTSLSEQQINMDEFGASFMEKWLKSPAYINWKLSHKNYTGIGKVEPLHMCRSDMTLKDLKLRLSAQASEYGFSDKSKEMVGQVFWQSQKAVNSVGGAVGGAWSAASSALSSWWYGSGEEEDV